MCWRSPPASRGSLFTNFEDVRLTDEEHVYLWAAAQGDVPIIRQSLEEPPDASLNINCVDYMGRNALHLAVDSENTETVELLLERISFECVEESLLHAISKGAAKIVRLMIEHPNYMAAVDRTRRSMFKDPFFRTDEKSQFSPDITPLLLAAHYNNHEIIQLFLARNETIDRPHPISCQCADCVTKQNYDSLKRSRSRLNAYRALASPAYMALSSPDPITTTFELRQEMKKLAQVEKEFKNEYLGLVEQCMTFACELMDLCRGTQEVEAVLGQADEDSGCLRDPLARLKMAIEYEEKKFVAHPNCQQHLTNIWYGPEMGFMQSMTVWKKSLMWIVCVPLVPFICLTYIISPETKVGHALRCPASKFITHTLSHACFLILLAAATFRLEGNTTHPVTNRTSVRDFLEPVCGGGSNGEGMGVMGLTGGGADEEECRETLELLLKDSFRPANILITNVQICLMFWILGLLWMECKQMYNIGVRVYLLDNYNWMDFIILSLYLSSYVLRFLVDHWIKQADLHYNGTTSARHALITRNYSLYARIETEIFDDATHKEQNYFMKASRFAWRPDDPEIVSDVLFAVANVLSIARTTYLMPAFEVLGPLQVSLGRMIGDITRFLVLFTLVLFAFMVGLHNLYWYYGSQTYSFRTKDGTEKFAHTSEAFQGLPRTLYSLFWSMFGLIMVDSVEIKYPSKETETIYANSFPMNSMHATSVVEGVGMLLFALYHVAIIIVLTNMLIAMMSHSFEAIQGDCDVEWKFARTKLWMNYIDAGNTLPVPYNMIPTPKSAKYLMAQIRSLCLRKRPGRYDYSIERRQTFIESRRERVCQVMQVETPQTSYADILQRLVRRYLFKLERIKEDGKEAASAATAVSENYLTTTDLYGHPSEQRQSENVDGRSDSAGNRDPAFDCPAPCDDSNPSLKIRLNQISIRPMGSSRRQRASRSPAVSGQFLPHQIQLISLPQLDIVQRSLKVLDVRVQRLQSVAADEDRVRQDTEHVLHVISENQKALLSIALVLGSVQEEVRTLGSTVQRQQATHFAIQPPTGFGATWRNRLTDNQMKNNDSAASSSALRDPTNK